MNESANPMRLLITGATGFLGRNLTAQLVDNGFSVEVTINKSPLDPELLSSVTQTSIEHALEKLVACEYDGIIHCATSYGRDGEINKVIESNLALPLRLLDKTNFEHTFFINIDSFFNKNVSHYYSLPHYSLTKKSLLTWLEYYSQHGLIVNMRLEHLYGHGDSQEKFVSKAIQEIGIQQNKAFNMTTGDQKRDFVYVTDVAAAIVTLLKNIKVLDTTFHEYEIGTSEKVSIKEFTQEIKRQAGSKTQLMFGMIPQNQGDIQESVASTKFSDQFNWKPEIDYIEGIRLCLESGRK